MRMRAITRARARVFGGINFGDLVKNSPIRQIKIPAKVSGYAVWTYSRKSLIQTHWDRRVFRYKKLASFQGSPHKRTKNQKGRGKPGKVYHARNVIGRENT